MGGRILEWIVDHVVPWIGIVVVVGLCLLLVALPVGCVMAAKSPTFSLQKDEWSCVKTHREPTTTYIQSGKVLVPVTSYHDVCDVYSRIGGEK